MSDQSYTIGLLTPQSSLYPHLSAHLSAGLRLGIAQSGQSVRVIDASIGVGQMLIEPMAQRLLAAERVDLLVGVLNPGLSSLLHQSCDLFRRNFLGLEIGANIIRSDELHQRCVYHTLQYWRASYALGQWAATRFGKRAIVLMSFYESGYDAQFAFRAGFEAAGGTITHVLITHQPPDKGDFPPLLEQIAQLKPDFVFGAYSGSAGAQFLSAYADSPLAGAVPLLSGAFSAEQATQIPAGGVYSALGWSPDADSAQLQQFVANLEQAGQKLDHFSLLGYEAGLLIAHAAARGDLSHENVSTQLTNTQLSGPRGMIGGSASFGEFAGPIYLLYRETLHGGSRIVATLPDNAAADAQIQSAQQAPRSGWINPYLCV